MSYAAFEATPQALLGQRQEEEEEQPQANGATADIRRAAALQTEDPMAAAAREEQARRSGPYTCNVPGLGCWAADFGCRVCNSAACSSPAESPPTAAVIHRLALYRLQGRSGSLAHLLVQLSSWSGGANSCCSGCGSADILALDIMALLLQLLLLLHSAAGMLCIAVLQCVLACLFQPAGVTARCQGGSSNAAGSMACL